MVASFQYDDGMRETSRTHGNNLTTDRSYNRNDNLVTDIDVAGKSGLSFDYQYDANKNPTAETTGGVMSGYSFTAGYDNEDRLTSWNRANGTDSQTWNLSLVGDWNSTVINGTTQNRTHNAVHEVTDIGGNSLTFDAKGNQLTDDKGRTFTWDIDNKLASADASNAGGEANLSFTYDAIGRRVSKSDGTTTTIYVCAGQQVVCEYDAGDDPSSVAPNQSYVYGTYVDEPLAKIDATNGTLYYHTNRLYCVTALTDSSGDVVERYAYAAYGVTTILDPAATTVRATSSVGNPYLYTGRRLDPEFASGSASTIYYYRARYYDPHQGRFIGRDPAGYSTGQNLYAYCDAQPKVYTDPSGMVFVTVNCPVGGSIPCYTYAGGPSGPFTSSWMDCNRLEQFIMNLGVGLGVSGMSKVAGLFTGAGISACCDCKARLIYKTVEVREWRGKIMYNCNRSHFFGERVGDAPIMMAWTRTGVSRNWKGKWLS